jgi:hypothetical protein
MNTIKQYKEVSIEEFIEAIEKLPQHDIRGGWIWWLRDYNKPGPYDRLTDQNHTAKFAYNHMTHPAMLIWLIEEAGVEKHLAKKAKVESGKVDNKKTQCGKIREQVPWEVLEHALWRSA